MKEKTSINRAVIPGIRSGRGRDGLRLRWDHRLSLNLGGTLTSD